MDYNLKGTATGRFVMQSQPAIHQLPKADPIDSPPKQGYLFRNTELIYQLNAHFLSLSDFVQEAQAGDLLLILHPGIRKKPQLYSRRQGNKYIWRLLKNRTELVQRLQTLALLQQA